MPLNITTPAHAIPVKWTRDEWDNIAARLYQMKGNRVLSADGVEYIKARDVFEAQDILPEQRRRKLISIAQGFQAIRNRLHGLFERGQRENRFPATALTSIAETPQIATPAVSPTSSLPLPDKKAPSRRAAYPDLFSEVEMTSNAPTDDAADLHSPRESREDGVAPHQATGIEPVFEGAVDSRERNTSPSVAPTTSTSERFSESVCIAPAPETQDSQSSTRMEQVGPSLIEVARPFVTMVCDEFARALVQAFSGQDSRHVIFAMLQSTASESVHRPHEPRAQREKRQVNNDHSYRTMAEHGGARQHTAEEAWEEEGAHPTEVQPLFDPKLPPSANSDFKPTIGLVATRAHEYEDLQMLYPQLRFAIVPAEDIQGPEVFRDCQRVIGLRDEVPQATEDLLKRTLRYRYIWLRGGVDRVREQLDAWLANPGSMQAGPRPSAPRAHKQAPNGNAKKRAKWPPRVA